MRRWTKNPVSRPLAIRIKSLPRRLPKRAYEMPDTAGLERILDALGKQETRALAATRFIMLCGELRGVVERLNERNAAAEIQSVALQLGKHRQLLRKYGTIYRSEIHNLRESPHRLFR